MNENSPIVAFDRRLGEHVDYIDVNYDELVDYMQERGFDDDVIKNTQINISGEVNSQVHKKSKTTKYTFGTYSKETDEINIYPRSEMDISQSMYDYYSEHEDQDLENMMVSEMDRSLSGKVSRTLGHELEHKLIKYEGGMRQEKVYQAKKLGKQAMIVFGSYAAILYGYREALEFWGTDTSGPVGSTFTALTSAGFAVNVPIFMDKFMPGAVQKNSTSTKTLLRKNAAVKSKSQLLTS